MSLSPRCQLPHQMLRVLMPPPSCPIKLCSQERRLEQKQRERLPSLNSPVMRVFPVTLGSEARIPCPG